MTPWGKYKFTVMPFGLKNAPAIFQSMDDFLGDCATFAVVYINDILIFSDSMEEHLSHIKEVMKALKKAGLKVKPPMCQWWARQLEYIGHEISNGKVAVPEYRVQARMECKQPVTKMI